VPRQSAFGGECRSSWEMCVPIRFRSANAVRPLWVFIYFIWGGGNAERGFEPGGESLQAARLHRLDHSATPHPPKKVNGDTGFVDRWRNVDG
jgi:hypothetical protein